MQMLSGIIIANLLSSKTCSSYHRVTYLYFVNKEGEE